MFQETRGQQCGARTITAPDGEKVCVNCGCVVERVEASGYVADTHEGVAPRSFDNGLGSEPLRTIREVRFNSRLLKNNWQTVLGYYMKRPA